MNALSCPSDRYGNLSEREKETLRLMVRGHDAKSMARELDLSVHTINDRLRAARRKLGVTSSREAARLLFESEQTHPQNLAPHELGGDFESARQEDGETPAMSDGPPLYDRPTAIIIGGIALMLMLTIIAATLMQGSEVPHEPSTPVTTASSSVPQAKLEDAESFARVWVAMVDEEGFDPANAAAAPGTDNLEGWNQLVERRLRFGRTIAREVQRIDIVHRSGRDQWIVRFRTDFENLRGAYETATLVDHGSYFVTLAYEVE